MSLRIIVVLSLVEISMAANPPMLTRASMDVGNIISIVIPESPDENVNVEQLTSEFRQQLERIKQQSRASKVENGLVALKRVMPEKTSRDEKRRTLPLIRRVHHGRRVANAASLRNWTREAARMDQAREAGQLARSRSAGNHEEKIYRDYEDGNRETVTTRVDQSPSEIGDDFRRVNERTSYDSRRDETAREDPGRRSEQISQEESIRRDESERAVFPNEDPTSSKMTRFGTGQSWNSQNWEDQSQGDARGAVMETSTVDCNDKLDRAIRQKEPGNEILQNDRYEKNARLSEPSVSGPDESNVDYAKLDQQMTSRYPFAKLDSADNAKRNFKDAPAFESADAPSLINYPGELDINGASNPDYEAVKKNRSGHSMKQRQEASTFEQENRGASQRIIQDPLEQSERSNLTGFENSINPGLAYVQTDQSGLRTSLDNEPKMAASVQFANYGNGRHPRIQRATNGTFGNATSDVVQINGEDLAHGTKGSLFDRLKHLFKQPPLTNVTYTSVIFLYADKSQDHDERAPKSSTETGTSLDRVSPSMVESTSSTSHEENHEGNRSLFQS